MAGECPDDERDEELQAIAAIYPEICIDASDSHVATLSLDVKPVTPLEIAWIDEDTTASDAGHSSDTSTLGHLPPLSLRIHLPDGYPSTSPPSVLLHTSPDWLPAKTISRLEAAAQDIWEEYGRSQVVFAYIDMLCTEAETVFGAVSPLQLSSTLKIELLEYSTRKDREVFEQGHYNCGVCLDPKPGTACHRMQSCQHVFCRECLQDFYSTAITQGEVDTVKCLDPDCGKAGLTTRQRRTVKNRTLHPRELLAIPLPTIDVQRYVNMKLKKKVESDKNTVYCPRQWCQAPARSAKYAKFFANSADLANYPDSDSESDDTPPAEAPKTTSSTDNRLAICSTCAYAFCRNCHRSWHGEHVACRTRAADSVEISAEDKASEDWIRMYTSPCPSCDTPCQKLFGCNHMICSQCKTHFCYLCSMWLVPDDPYKHFNQKGRGCYMRLWDLEEGDRGDENPGGRVEFGGARGFEIGHVEGRDPVVAAAAAPQQQAAAPAANDQGQRGLQRFLEMARNDEEDEWDSDGLEDEITEQLVILERPR